MRIEKQYQRLEHVRYTIEFSELRQILFDYVQAREFTPKGGCWDCAWEINDDDTFQMLITQTFVQDIEKQDCSD